MHSANKTIWLVDDNEPLLAICQNIIESTGIFNVTGIYTTAEKVIVHLKREQPDIILMDIELPGKSGIDCTWQIKREFPSIEVIMSTVHEDNETVFEALKAGASGYITKSSSHHAMLEGLAEIARGGAPMSTKIARMVTNSFHTNSDSPLSKREQQILKLLSAGKTFSQVSRELMVARETIKSHVRNIYFKLEATCRAQAISIASKNKFY